jgi:hypothetical protein
MGRDHLGNNTPKKAAIGTILPKWLRLTIMADPEDGPL